MVFALFSGMDNKALTIRIPKEIHRYIKIYCAKNGLTLQSYINDAIRDKLRRDEETQEGR